MLAGRGPRTLAAIVLAGAAVTALVAGRLSADQAAPTTPPPAALASPASASSADPAPSSATSPAPLQNASVRSAPEAAAAEAIAAWQEQDIAARTSGLAATATPTYQQAAHEIEPSRVPNSPLAATSLRVEADGQALVDATLENGTTLVALLVQIEDRWLLDDLQPTDDTDGADAAGAP